MALLMFLMGCGTTPKPNQAQKWGVWSHIPGTASFSARVAEQVKQPRVDEALKANVTATVEALQAETNNTAHIAAARTFVRQAQREAGLPDKPVDIRPLFSTNPVVRAAAQANVERDFAAQDRDMRYVRKVASSAADQGVAIVMQDSTAGVTWWKTTTGIKSFINAHWLAILLSAGTVLSISAKVLPLFFPWLGPVFGFIGGTAGSLFGGAKLVGKASLDASKKALTSITTAVQTYRIQKAQTNPAELVALDAHLDRHIDAQDYETIDQVKQAANLPSTKLFLPQTSQAPTDPTAAPVSPETQA